MAETSGQRAACIPAREIDATYLSSRPRTYAAAQTNALRFVRTAGFAALLAPSTLAAAAGLPWLTTPEPTISASYVAALDSTPADLDDGWPRSTPSAEGLHAKPLAMLLRRVETGSYTRITSLVMARHGRLVLERYFGGHSSTDLHETRSTFKSITGLLTGIAVADGLIDAESRAAPLIARFHEPSVDAELKRDVRVRHLLQMTSGFDCAEMPGQQPQREDAANDSDDPLAAHFSAPMADPPGTLWRYCSANTYLLGVALESALLASRPYGLRFYLHDRLFDPLGVTHYRLGGQNARFLAMHGGARLRSRDLARFGQLVVGNGRWRGRQIVPAAWIAMLGERGTPTGWSWTRSAAPEPALMRESHYRNQWFQTLMPVRDKHDRLVDVELIHSWGNGGQFIVAVPQYELVVVVTGRNFGARNVEQQMQVFHMLHRYILPAVATA